MFALIGTTFCNNIDRNDKRVALFSTKKAAREYAESVRLDTSYWTLKGEQVFFKGSLLKDFPRYRIQTEHKNVPVNPAPRKRRA